MSALPDTVARFLPMEATDIANVIGLERRVYEFPWTEGIFRDCLKAGYACWMLVEGDQRVLGYAVLSMAVGEAHVLNLCIDPDCRRRGLGRLMLQHLLGIARAALCTIVLLEVRRSNKAAIRLYHSAGFRQIGTRRNYYPAAEGREDAFVLALDLD